MGAQLHSRIRRFRTGVIDSGASKSRFARSGACVALPIVMVVAVAPLASCNRAPCGEQTSEANGPVVRLDFSLASCNAAPVAKIVAPRSAPKKTLIEFDGSMSTDPNDDVLTYKWSFTEKPAACMATLDDTTSSIAKLTPDLGGIYTVQLEVSDGELMGTTKAVVMAVNMIPVANAGADFTSPLSMPATLDGSGSSDGDDDPLTYSWTIKSQPAGSQVQLTNPSTPAPVFTPTTYGVYVVGLTLNDGESDSVEDTVRVGAGITGVPPVANAGPDSRGILGVRTMLDGSRSSDPEGASLSYAWRVRTEPPKSLARAEFVTATVARPLFTPTKEGIYTLELTVQDDFYSSPPDTVQLTVTPGTGRIGGPCEPLGCPMFAICLVDQCVSRGGCGSKTEAGGDTPETHQFDLGQPSGKFDFKYETYSIKDQVIVLYEGSVLLDTGCVGENRTVPLNYSGSSTLITVTVTPNCDGTSRGTQWEFEVGCPP